MAAVPMTSPAHLFGLEAVHLVAGGDGGTDVRAAGRQLLAFQWMWHQRRGLRAGGKRRRARGNSHSDFQKVAAFHDISLWQRVE